MQSPGGLKVQGIREINKSLRIIGTPVKEINAANREAASEIVQDAKRLTPVRRGRLQRTVKAKVSNLNVAITAGNESSVPYANPIHWGWSRSVKTGQRKNIKPQPFLARALGYNRGEILANYYKQLDKLIRTQVARNKLK